MLSSFTKPAGKGAKLTAPCIIPDVPAFERNDDAAGMAMTALEAALATRGGGRPAWWLAGMSGDAFKFVYDRGAVFEPLRDRVPLDVLTLACRAAGWDGQWRCGLNAAQAAALVQASVQRGCPVITPFLGSKWYHGMVLIVGIDAAKGVYFLRVARERGNGHETVCIPERWDGPVPGPLAWADTPLFLLQGRLPPPGPDEALRAALGRAVELFEGAPLPYAAHPGAQRYSEPPLAGRAAFQGEAALHALKEEVAAGGIVGFDLIWRIDAQLGQLRYDRGNAARCLRAMAEQHQASGPLQEAALHYEVTAQCAGQLQAAFWDKRLQQTAELRSLHAAIDGSASLVYAVGHLPPGELATLRCMAPVLETPWGPAAVIDAPQRRGSALELVDRIIEREHLCVALLRKALGVGRA